MKHNFTLYVLVLFLGIGFLFNISESQYSKGAEFCASKKQNSTHIFASQEWFASPKHSFDVLHYELNLDIYNCFLTPYPSSFAASNTITFRVDSSLNNIKLNAVNTSLTIDSVRLAGVSFTHSSNILTIALDSLYQPGAVVTVKIYYRHNNTDDGSFNVSGGFVFTDCEPEGARKWYPCWDRPSDKATLDLFARTPVTVKLGSNGRLADSTNTGTEIIYHWSSRDTISTYLVVISAKVGYNLDIVYWHKLSNPNDSVPMRFYSNAGENITNAKARIIPMTTRFSQLFGEHPFEKNGFATLNNDFIWGGMENQTLTSLCPGCWGENLMSHEFAHQWFGDMITCGTWADIWLNEGFATYLESIWLEYTGGYNAYKNDINNNATAYISQNPGWAMYNPAWVDNPPDINTLFNTAITYYKGACVLHMLRYTLGDTVFFNALNSYATDTTSFKFKNVTTDDFAAKLSSVAGQDMSWFIDEWVKSPNHPVYQNTYGFTNLGNGQWEVKFKTKQTQTNSVFRKMPLTLRIRFGVTGDTLVKVMNDSNNQVFSFTFGKQPTNLTFDPNNDIVLKQATTTLGVMQTGTFADKFSLAQNYPNPFNPQTTFRFQIANFGLVTLKIYDVLGKEVATLIENERMESGKYEIPFDASGLPSGMYFYRLTAGSFSGTKKLILMR